MPKLIYESWKPKAETRDVVRQARDILEEYADQGFDLTLRQLYYQFVARGLIPNKQSEYNKLGSVINKARLAGMIDWDHIEDRTRNLESLTHFRDPAHVIKSSLNWFHTDRWADQPYHVKVWVEKDALVGVIEPTCNTNDVAFFSCRGYTSQSEMWTAGQRLLARIDRGQKVRILHLGDHDPSGIDMTRDIEERIFRFLAIDWWRSQPQEVTLEESLEFIRECFQVDRLALNMDQIEQYAPPPNPAKMTDSRFEGYEAEHGSESWELDALEPSVLADLIADGIEGYRDEDLWDAANAREEEFRVQLFRVSERWQDVEAMLNGDGDV